MTALGHHGTVVGVHRDGAHRFAKPAVDEIELVAGIGVAGDAHAGATVQHRSRVARDPQQPNLRQVHLLSAEVLDDLADRGFTVAPGAIGENVTTRGIDLLGLATGSTLRLGPTALVTVTGLRNPCVQLDDLALGLLAALRSEGPEGTVVRRAGVMAVVVLGGRVRVDDPIEVGPPPGPPVPLRPV